MPKLRARVRTVTGSTKHFVFPNKRIPPPDAIEIVEGDGGWYLFHLNAQGTVIADTHHRSLEEAKRQAAFEFALSEQDWIHEP